MARDFAKDFYNSSRWRKCAKTYAASKCYICERCHNQFKPINKERQRYIVHHKTPLTPDNIHDDAIAYGWDNLMFLCIECHNAIHARRSGGGRVMRFDADGQLIAVDEAPTPPA